MIQVSILEDSDQINPDDWCRPLVLYQSSGERVATTNSFSGCPTNNLKWVKVDRVFGEVWFGKAVRELNAVLPNDPYEFLRGEPPHDHQLPITEKDP